MSKSAQSLTIHRCLTLAFFLSAASANLMAQQDVQVSERDGLLSVQASNTSASHLAEVLAERLGISVVVTGDTEALVNIDIVDEPLAKALAKLSPNHMLVRSSKLADSSIVEVVLMMGEEGSSQDSGGSDDQFLPSGSPADDVVVIDDQQSTQDGADPLDPNGAAAASESIEASSGDSAGQPADAAEGYPAPDSFDPVTGLPIDPATGLPVEQ
ncbi:MAG: hypothetical protein HKN42_10155 [Granulosicoccus sp.]|nr:hypothetical protein [Granulosicoccus sp.]